MCSMWENTGECRPERMKLESNIGQLQRKSLWSVKQRTGLTLHTGYWKDGNWTVLSKWRKQPGKVSCERVQEWWAWEESQALHRLCLSTATSLMQGITSLKFHVPASELSSPMCIPLTPAWNGEDGREMPDRALFQTCSPGQSWQQQSKEISGEPRRTCTCKPLETFGQPLLRMVLQRSLIPPPERCHQGSETGLVKLEEPSALPGTAGSWFALHKSPHLPWFSTDCKLCSQTFSRKYHKWLLAAVNDWKWQILMSNFWFHFY